MNSSGVNPNSVPSFAHLPGSQPVGERQSAPPAVSQASQVPPSQAGAQSRAVPAEHDPVRLAQKIWETVPAGRLEEVVQQMQARIAHLYQRYVPAMPGKAVNPHVSNQSHDAYQPYQQPYFRKNRMAEAIEHVYGRRGGTALRFGVGALAGAGLTAATFGLSGLGGSGLLCATGAVCGIASFGFLGAGLYGSYKLVRHLQNSWQPPPPLPSHAQMMGSWVPGSCLQAVQHPNRAATQYP